MPLVVTNIRTLVYANTVVVESPTDDTKVANKIQEVMYLSEKYLAVTGDILDESNYNPLQQQFLAYYTVWFLECEYISEQAATQTTGDPDIFVKKVKADVVEKEWAVKGGSSSSSSSGSVLGKNALKKLCMAADALSITAFPPCKDCDTTAGDTSTFDPQAWNGLGLSDCLIVKPLNDPPLDC